MGQNISNLLHLIYIYIVWVLFRLPGFFSSGYFILILTTFCSHIYHSQANRLFCLLAFALVIRVVAQSNLSCLVPILVYMPMLRFHSVGVSVLNIKFWFSSWLIFLLLVNFGCHCVCSGCWLLFYLYGFSNYILLVLCSVLAMTWVLSKLIVWDVTLRSCGSDAVSSIFYCA